MKFILLCIMLISSLWGLTHFPQVQTVLKKTDRTERIYKMVLNKNKTQILILRRNSLSIVDAKSFKVLKKLTFKGAAWDCDFTEEGFVLLTHHDFSYYDTSGNNRLFYQERDNGGQFKKIDVQKNGYLVNIIKEEKRGQNVRLFIFNLRTLKYQETSFKTDNTKKAYLEDIQGNILKIYHSENNSYSYINILTQKEVDGFPSKPLLSNQIEYIDIKSLSLKSSITKKVLQTYQKPAGRIHFGCMDNSGKRFAIFAKNKPVYVYDIHKHKAIFTLPANLNIFKTRNCLLYDNTLIMQGRSIQTYNIEKEKGFYNNFNTALKVMPIIGTCIDKAHSVSLWVNTMYGWDTQKGKMRWYNQGPKINRSHWQNASYLMKVESKENWALIQPYGLRMDSRELRVKLEDGTFIAWGNKKRKTLKGNPVVCDPGTGELWLEKTYSFKHNHISFYALNQGEWLSISEEDGYFNASSIKVLSLLNKAKHPLTKKDIQKWYRPDIIEAKLSNKNIESLKRSTFTFTLPKASSLVNQYRQSLIKQIVKDNDYKKMRKFIRKATDSEMKTIAQAIIHSDSEEGYFAFYAALVGQKFSKNKAFILQRIKKLTKDSKETPELLRYLTKKKQLLLVDQIKSNIGFNSASKKAIVIASRDFEHTEDLMWEVWGKQHFLYSQQQLEFLTQKDKKRASSLAINTLIQVLENLKKCDNGWTFETICQSETSRKRDGVQAKQIQILYEYLTKYPVKTMKNRLKKLTFTALSTFYSAKTYTFFKEGAILINFYMTYASKSEKKKLISLTRDFLEKSIFKTDWEGRAWGQTDLSTLRIKIEEMIKSMKPFDTKTIQNIQLRIIQSPNVKMREALSKTIDIKEPVIQNAIIQNVLKKEKNNAYIDNHYINILLETKNKKILFKTIDMFNTFNDCTKVRDWYRYKLKEGLSLKEYQRFQCQPFKKETIPYGSKEYESFNKK